MWRNVICLSVALSVAGVATAQERKIAREVRKGEVVRVDPARNVVVVKSGVGAEAREFEYRVGPTTKYWGADRRAFDRGLRHEAFRPGANIWYVPGTDAQAVSELWFADPNVQVTDQPEYLEGKIVRVDPVTNKVVVETTVGTQTKEVEYLVDPATKYWGVDQQPFTTALRYEGFRPGANIWFRAETGERSRYVNEVRFYNPRGRPIIRK